MANLIVSQEVARLFEVATYAGYEIRGNPDGIEAPNGSYRWGTGVAFPSRSPLRVSAEVNGDLPTNYRATLTDNSVVGDEGACTPLSPTSGTGHVRPAVSPIRCPRGSSWGPA